MSAASDSGFALRRAASLLGSRPWRFLLGLVTAALAVALLLAAGVIAVGVAPRVAGLMAGPQLSVFVAVETAQSELSALQSRLGGVDGAPAVRLIPRAQAFAELTQRAGSAAGAESRANPLPDVLVARFALGTDPAVVERAATEVRSWRGVDAVEADVGWYRRLAALVAAAGAAGAVTGGLALLLAIIALPVAAAAQVRLSRSEATVLHMVGATRSFIVRPHACAAALTLALGAILGLALLAVALASAQPQLAAAAAALGPSFAWPRLPVWLPAAVAAAAALLGWIVGWCAAWLTAQRRAANM